VQSPHLGFLVFVALFGVWTLSAYAAGERCSEEAGSRSIEWSTPTSIAFDNNTGDVIRVYWIDYEGVRKFYSEVVSGQSYVQRTYVTHPWVVTNRNYDCLGVYMPGVSPRRIELGTGAATTSQEPAAQEPLQRPSDD
jgi:hypothetical protein